MKASIKRTALQHPNPVEHEVKSARPGSPSDGVVVHVVGADSASPSASFHNPVDISASAHVVAPSSPSSVRERFLKGLLPSRTCCNLDLIKSPAGTKFNLTAVCIAVFPATQNPDRRYIQLADITGSVGVTVWNHNVEKFSSSSVGRLVTLVKAVIGNHQGKKQLSMARDSSVDFCDDPKHSVASWWQELLLHPAKTCGSVHDMADNSIANVSGILGFISTETKIVNGREKNLLTLHMVDASGKLDIRSWNHSADMFLAYVERPVLIRRVRVTSFAGTKLCELLDGSGSVFETSFIGDSALVQFWSS